MTALALLCRRASTLHATACEDIAGSASLRVVGELSLFSAALSTLAALTRGASSSPVSRELIVSSACDCTHQLRRRVASLPASADISEKIMSAVFVTAKHSHHFFPADATYELVRETTSRFSNVNLLVWKPKQLLAALHAMSKSCAGGPPLPMAEDLIAHLEGSLSQLNARDTATFLWCLASFQWFERSPSLWENVCRRCLLLFTQMNTVSCATILQAVLLTPTQCESHAQQELMSRLQEGNPREPASSRGHTHKVRDSSGGEHKGLRLRLLTSVDRLPTEVQLTLLERLCRKAAPAPSRTDPDVLTEADKEELAYLFEHLSRKHLTVAHCVTVLEVMVAASMSNALAALNLIPGSHKAWRRAVTEVVSPEASSAKALAALSPTEVQRRLETLGAVGRCSPSPFPRAASGSSSDTDALLLDRVETKQFVEALTSYLTTHMRTGQNDLQLASARSVWSAASAVDLLNTLGTLLHVDSGTPTLPDATECVSMYPAKWEQRGLAARAGMELIVLAKATSLNGATTSSQRQGGVCHALVSRVACSLVEMGKQADRAQLQHLDARRILEFGIAVEGAEISSWIGTDVEGLRALWPPLLQAQREHTPLLRELTEVIYLNTTSKPQRSLGGLSFRSGTCFIPDTLLDMWVRHLQSEGATALTRPQEDALLGCFQQRLASPDALERAFLLLMTRRLGESRTLLQTRTPSVPAVVRLADHACELAKHKPVTASTILFTLIQHLSREVSSGTLTLDTLNDVASLLSSRACQDRDTRNLLANAVKEGATTLLTTRSWPAESKAFLVAYLVRAQVELDTHFLAALRAFPSTE